jgi:hypothetical protein
VDAGRVAALRRGERIARREGNETGAEAVADTRRDLGDLTAEELPVKGYDSMTTAQIAQAVDDITEPEELDALIRYEETHKGRASAVSAIQTRLAALAKEAVGIDS